MSAVNGIQITPAVEPGNGGGSSRKDGAGSGFGAMMAEASPQDSAPAQRADGGGKKLQGDGDTLPPAAEQGGSSSSAEATAADTAPGPAQTTAADNSRSAPPPPVAEAGAVPLPVEADAVVVASLTPVAVPTALKSDGRPPGESTLFAALPNSGTAALQASLAPAKPGSTSLPPGGALFAGPGAGLSLAMEPLQPVSVPAVGIRPGVLNEPALEISARFEGVMRSGAERMSLETLLPDTLLSRGGEGSLLAGQGTAGSTSALSAAMFGGLDASGELQLQSAQRADLSSQLLQRAADRSWNGEFAGRLTTMVKNGVQEASLQLNPAELGRMEVQIATDGDQTRVQFLVQNAAAREAVEQAMPRLREMLEESGLQLAHSDVADQSQSQEQQRGYAEENSSSSRGAGAAPAETAVAVQQLTGGGLIDHYA